MPSAYGSSNNRQVFFFLRFPCSDFHNGHSDVGGSINVAAYLLQFVNATDNPESEPKSCYIYFFSMDFHCSYARDLIIIYFDILLVRKWRIKAQLVWLPSHRKLKCSAKNCKFMHMNEYSLIYRSYCWLFAVYLLPLRYWSKYITNALDEIESNQVAVLASLRVWVSMSQNQSKCKLKKCAKKHFKRWVRLSLNEISLAKFVHKEG